MLPEIIENNLHWWIAGTIVVLGLLVYGLGDVRRFSLTRAWAISSVCFAESIRRRVILIPLLAIVGVLGISQFIRGGEQDIVRQTIKYSLFATGMVVTITTVLLACTNLPREIENRVIYTVVTKPTTRLEIVIGKVLGFSKVSLLILLIMGLFTYAFVRYRAAGLRSEIEDRLASGTIEPLSRPTFDYLARNGLLSSRTFAHPVQLQVFAHEPGPDSKRWFYGAYDGDFVVPFLLSPEELTPAGAAGAGPGDAGMIVQLHLGFEKSLYDPTPEEERVPTTGPTTRPEKAQVVLEFLDGNLNLLTDHTMINGGRVIEITDPTGATPTFVQVSPEGTRNLLRSPLFFVSVAGSTAGVEYFVNIAPPPPTRVDLNPVSLIVRGVPDERSRLFGPIYDGAAREYRPAPPMFRGKGGLYGQMLRGGLKDRSPVGIYTFRDAPPAKTTGDVAFELKVRLELNSSDGEEDQFSRFEVIVLNRLGGKPSTPVIISPESNRTTYFTLPAEILAGGDFDLYVRNLGSGHFATIDTDSLRMVASEESFDSNLLKSLGILWMLSVLVVIISICCSTFLSWPIAIVLTLLLLLGNWGIMQVSDILAPGIGNQVAQDIFGAERASEARVVSAYVEGMARVLNQMAKVLPDLSRFAAIDDIEQGITISRQTLVQPIGVLLTFGLPMLVLSYVFLRNKEVAP